MAKVLVVSKVAAQPFLPSSDKFDRIRVLVHIVQIVIIAIITTIIR